MNFACLNVARPRQFIFIAVILLLGAGVVGAQQKAPQKAPSAVKFNGAAVLNANKTSAIELEYVAKACDNIVEVMERVTKLYEAVKA